MVKLRLLSVLIISNLVLTSCVVSNKKENTFVEKKSMKRILKR